MAVFHTACRPQLYTVHEAVIEYRPRRVARNDVKENVLKYRLYEVLNDKDKVEKVFLIIKQQGEY